MKKVEKESLFKSFLLFFISQSLLVGALFFINFTKEKQVLDEQIFSKMRICSFNLQCDEFGVDFVSKDEHELYKLYKEQKELSAYFSIPDSQKYYLKIYLAVSEYEKKIALLKKQLGFSFVLVLLIIAVLSFVFSLYTLSPLRNALRMTEEFIKDILHDFNTPLATLRLNVAMLKSESKESKKIKRIENSVENILTLQSNLRAYLHAHPTQKEPFVLSEILQERIELLAPNYKEIHFHKDINDVVLYANRDSFVRIVDNLLSNAAKYNKKGGEVFVVLEGEKLIFKDTGKGIKNPKRVFERFYKEQERGIGIGLHIVKKLCDELGVEIALQSEVGEGSIFTLNIASLLKR